MAAYQPQFRGAAAATGRAGNGTFSPALPQRAVDGDLIVIEAFAESGALAITTDGGGAWTAITGSPFGSSGKLYGWYRIHNSATDSAPTLTSSGQASTAANIAAAYAIQRETFDASSPIDAVGTASTGTSATPNNAGVTTNTNGALAVHAFGINNDGTISSSTFGGSSSGVSTLLDVSSTQGNDSSIGASAKRVATAGASGAASISHSAGSFAWVSVTYAIKPDPTTRAVRVLGSVEGGGSAISSRIITVNQPVAIGDRIIVVAAGAGQLLSTVVDTGGNTYVEHVDFNSTKTASIASCTVTTALNVGDTITVTWGGTASVAGAAALVATGYGSSPDTATGSGAVGSSTWATSSVTRPNKPALIVAVGSQQGTAATFTPNSGYTEFFEGISTSGQTNGEGIYKEVTGSGTDAAGGTPTVTGAYAAAMAVFYQQLVDTPTSVASDESVGQPSLSAITPHTIDLTGDSIASDESLGQPTLAQVAAQTVQPQSIDSDETAGQPTIAAAAPHDVQPTSIASDETVATPTLTHFAPDSGIILDGNSIESDERVGTPTIQGVVVDYPSVVMLDSPIRYWRLGESSGTVAVDHTGHANGAYVNSPTLGVQGVIAGDTDKAVRCDGVNDYVTLPIPTIGGSSGLQVATIEDWFKWSAGVTTMRDNSGAGNGFITAYVSGSKLYVRIGGSSFNTGLAASALRNDVWHHVVLVMVRNGTSKLYIDGVVVWSAATGAFGASVTDWRVYRNGTFSQYSKGDADEIAVYDHELSAARVLAHYNSGIGARTPDHPIVLNSIASAESVGQPTIVTTPPVAPTFITPLTIASVESVGTPTVVNTSATSITPTSIASAESVGQPNVLAVEIIAPNSVQSEEDVSAAAIILHAPHEIVLDSIASDEGVGTPTVAPAAVAPPGDPDPVVAPTREAHPDFHTRWASGLHVGDQAPVVVVEVRRGRWFRDYRTIPAAEVINASIPGEDATFPWLAYWQEAEGWQELPGVEEYTEHQSFQENGVQLGTITVDNVRFAEETGAAGLYHRIERGYLSPTRGFEGLTRPDDGLEKNEWYDRLDRMAQVRIWMGYGEPVRGDVDHGSTMPVDGGPNGFWAFMGQIDDLDLADAPDKIVLTVRNGQPLTDEEFFGWNKSKQLREPVVFADRLEADSTTYVGYDPSASSSLAGTSPDMVIDADGSTAWKSQNHTTADNTEWVEISLPDGRYTDFELDPLYAGMELYIGFHMPPEGGTVNGESVGEGWVDRGDGVVPGSNGGWPYVKQIASISDRRYTRQLGAEMIASGPGAKLRVGFRSLHKITDNVYRAGVTSLRARLRTLSEQATKGNWVLVDDVADIVRVILRWAGYRYWAIEDVGARMKGHRAYNRQHRLIDPIRDVADQAGYSFYFTPPVDGNTLAVPVFRMNGAREVPPEDGSLIELTEDDLLTGVQYKESMEPLAYIIRYRGKKVDATDPASTTLEGDRSSRVMAVYRPPWSYQPGQPDVKEDRLGGLLKHVTETEEQLRDAGECLEACKLLAFAEALAALQAVTEIPGHPGLLLDEQVGVRDSTAAINSRMWIAERQTTLRTGENTSFKTTLTGPLLDFPDVEAMLADLGSIGFGGTTDPVTGDPGSTGGGDTGTGGAGLTIGEIGGPSNYRGLDFDDEFEGGTFTTANWSPYYSPGHAGHGLRRPSQITVTGTGALRIRAENKVDPADGITKVTSGGMSAKKNGSKYSFLYGRAELRARVDVDTAGVTSGVAITGWPISQNNAVDGENDVWETGHIAGTRRPFNIFIHYADGSGGQFHVSVDEDGSVYHDIVMEWDPGRIRVWVDGVLRLDETDSSRIPAKPMTPTLQLDAFTDDLLDAPVDMNVEFIRIYTTTAAPLAADRPYAPTSWLNKQLPAALTVDPRSATIINEMWSATDGFVRGLTPNTRGSEDFQHPYYINGPNDPQVTLRRNGTRNDTPNSVDGFQVRIPANARAAGGSDAHMVIIDQATGLVISLDEVTTPGPYSEGQDVFYGAGGKHPITSIGGGTTATEVHAVASATGALAGIIRFQEMQAAEAAQSMIPHALFMVVKTTNGQMVYPARDAGVSGGTNWPATGQWLQLNRTLAQIDALPGIYEWQRVILRTLATYGAWVGDQGSAHAFELQTESPETFVALRNTNPWLAWCAARAGQNISGAATSAPSLDLDTGLGSSFWTSYLRVIAPSVIQANVG